MEAEDEGRWEGRERTIKRGRHTERGKYESGKYKPTYPEAEAAAALSDSEPEILFALWGKEAVTTVVVYTELAFDIFNRDYFLILFH